MSSPSGTADRLRSFGQAKFGKAHGWKKRFADALGVSPQHLDRYLSGASEPGKKMFMRLIQLGCDVHWLLTGDKESARDVLSGEEMRMLTELRKAGIFDVDQVRNLLNAENLAEDIAAAAVKEIKSKYLSKRRGR